MKLTGFKLLDAVLQKMGVGTLNNLTPDEKQTYEHWTNVLGKTITVEDVTKFLAGEIARLRDLREKEEKDPLDDVHRAQLINYKQLLTIISAPDRERAKLEKELQAMVGDYIPPEQGEKET